MITINADEMLQNALGNEQALRQQINQLTSQYHEDLERLNHQLWGLRGQIDLLNHFAHMAEQQAEAQKIAEHEVAKKEAEAQASALLDQQLRENIQLVREGTMSPAELEQALREQDPYQEVGMRQPLFRQLTNAEVRQALERVPSYFDQSDGTVEQLEPAEEQEKPVTPAIGYHSAGA